MSLLNIRRSLEKRLALLEPTFPTAYENHPFLPAVGTAHQRVTLLPAETVDDTFSEVGGNVSKYIGLMQVSLYYPTSKGSVEALSKAEAILDQFYRGLSLSEGAVDVRILRRGSIHPALVGDEWYVVPVSIPYTAFVPNT